MKSIVFATDFLESSRLALDYAVGFAHRYGARLTVMHAFELSPEAQEVELLNRIPSMTRENARARLEAFASGVRRLGVPTEIDLREGQPFSAILAAASENNADLLVLGTHGIYRGLQHVLLGSNAEKILLSARCPTLTVGRHVMAGIDLDLNLSQILCVSDFSRESVAAARYAVSLERDLGVPARLLQVAPEGWTRNSHGIHPAVERFCRELRAEPGFSDHQWCNPVYHRNRILPSEEIIRHAAVCIDSLLVCGVHGASRLDRHLHTSFAFELAARAGCPLISVHEKIGWSDRRSETV